LFEKESRLASKGTTHTISHSLPFVELGPRETKVVVVPVHLSLKLSPSSLPLLSGVVSLDFPSSLPQMDIGTGTQPFHKFLLFCCLSILFAFFSD
jgi:hypothetical protein